jgi:triosephosphate isomerase
MSSKNIYLGFNWKMNPATLDEAKDLLHSYKNAVLKKSKNIEIAVFVPSIFYYPLLDLKKQLKLDIKLGIQDISSDLSGAKTGEISVSMLDKQDSTIIIGHSETRKNFALDNQAISKKTAIATVNGVTPVICIGYSKSLEVNFMELQEQLKTALECINLETLKTPVIIAYEPVWAIGTGKTADQETVSKVTNFIKDFIKDNFLKLIEKTKILYGGSVKSDNVLELSKISNLDGFLIGGASLDINQFDKILESLEL